MSNKEYRIFFSLTPGRVSVSMAIGCMDSLHAVRSGAIRMEFSSVSLRTLLENAGQACAAHRCEEAVESLEQAVRLQPGNFKLHYQLGFCHTGRCRPHSLADPDIALGYLSHARRLAEKSDDRLGLAEVLSALGNTYTLTRQLAQGIRLQAAVECHRAAAVIYREDGHKEEWGREEYNAGNAWCELPEAQFPEKWRQAIVHYEAALKVRTRESNPESHAATLQNLGTAYRELPTGEKTAHVTKAIRCYRLALRVYRPASFPLKNAALHNNLGTAYLSLPGQSVEARRHYARRALQHLDRALRVRTRSAYPLDYGITQYNRGQAYLLLASADPEISVDLAVHCFTEAHASFLASGQRQQAAMAEKRLTQIQAALATP